VTRSSTRRRFFGQTIASATTLALGTQTATAFQTLAAMQEESLGGEATSPTWVFVLHSLQDPYAGEIVRPEEQAPGTRYLGADVEIRNESGEPLNFAPGGVRLVDADGFEYTSGAVAGSEPLLPSLNMLSGDRVRGWVWYAVPEAAQVVELAYVAPPPRLAVRLSPGSERDEGATPEVG